jgi:SPP1 gp7 family putative phage head morphogenesis protein
LDLNARFNLAALAKGKTKRKLIEFREIKPRLASEQAFYRIIMAVLIEATARRAEILEAAADARRELTGDAATIGTIMQEMRAAMSQAASFATGPLTSLFANDARRHGETWIGQVNRLIGVDLSAVVRSSDVQTLLHLEVQKSVALIRGLSEDVAKRIEFQVIDLVSQGKSQKDIAAALTETAGFTRKRALFIARDQAASFNGALNQIRQEQAGVTSYIWRTVGDQRVRPAHRLRNGQRFRWDSPPSDGHPGRPANCRCTAQAVLDLDEAPRPGRARASRAGLSAVASALGIGL